MSLLLSQQGGASFIAAIVGQTVVPALRAVRRQSEYLVAPVLVAAATVIVQPDVSAAQPQRDARVRPATTQAVAVAFDRSTDALSANVEQPRLDRRGLPVAVYASIARADGLEQLAVPPLSWRGTGPDATRRATLPAAASIDALAFTQQALAAVTPALSWLGSAPDRTIRLSLAAAQHTGARAEAIEQLAVPALSWAGLAPSTTRRSSLPTALDVDGLTYALQALTVVVPPNAWQPQYADSTRRLTLPTAAVPTNFRGEALEQFSVPPVSWLGVAPSSTRRASLLAAHDVDGLAYALQDVAVVVPPLSWQPRYADATRRNALSPTAMPAVFRGEALEQFAPKLLWSSTGPDATRRACLSIAQHPATSWTPSDAPNLGWRPTYPDRTRRAELPRPHLPTFAHSEAIEQFRPTLLWSAVYPDRTRRAALSTAQAAGAFATPIMSASQSYTEAIISSAPIVWLRLDDDGLDGLAHDATGHGNNASIVGTVYPRKIGAVSDSLYAMGFDAAVGASHLSLPHSATLDAVTGTHGFSEECWINPGLEDGSIFPGALGLFWPTGCALGLQWQDENDSPTRRGYWFATGNLGSLSLEVYSFDANGFPLVTIDGLAWTQLVHTYDGSTLKLYVNGHLVASTLASGANIDFILAGAQIGTYGRLDEVSIYGRALSPDEIAVHYRLGRLGQFPPFSATSLQAMTTLHWIRNRTNYRSVSNGVPYRTVRPLDHRS